jgi:molybdopterin synthase catalytic subunit
MVRLTHELIDYHALTEQVRRPGCGGVVLFLGTVRDLTGDRVTVAGEVSVAVAVSCPHRAEAFEACHHAIDRLKELVPIWKKENWADGSTEWVHPGEGG